MLIQDITTPVFTRIRRYILVGIVTLLPLWATWFILHLLWQLLTQFGGPIVHTFADWLAPNAPVLYELADAQWFQVLFTAFTVAFMLYLIGMISTQVIGQKIWQFFDNLMNHIPLIKVIYGSVQKFITTFQKKPEDGLQRVVMIGWPNTEVKTVGFLTRMIKDKDTGESLAVVYVPTAINPTCGYMSIVPLDKLIMTDWTMDQAMTFVVSGGVVAPDEVNYSKSKAAD